MDSKKELDSKEEMDSKEEQKIHSHDFAKEQLSAVEFDGSNLTIKLNYASLCMLKKIILNINDDIKIDLGESTERSYRKVVVPCLKEQYLEIVKYLYNDNYQITLEKTKTINEKEIFHQLEDLHNLQICVHGDKVKVLSQYNIYCNKTVEKIEEPCNCCNKIKIFSFQNYKGNNFETFNIFFECPIFFSLMTEPPELLNCGHIFTPTTIKKLEEDKCPICKEKITTIYRLDLINKIFDKYEYYLLEQTVKYNDKKIIPNTIKPITFNQLTSTEFLNFDSKDIISRMIHEFRKKILNKLRDSNIKFKIFGGLILREVMKKFDENYHIPSDVDIDIKVKNRSIYNEIIKLLRNFYRCPKITKLNYNGMKGYRHKIFQKENLCFDNDIICVYIDIVIDLPQNPQIDFDVNQLHIESENTNFACNDVYESILFNNVNDTYSIIEHIKKKRTDFLFNKKENENQLKHKINNRYRKIYNKGFSVNNIFIKIEEDKLKLPCGCVVDNIDNISKSHRILTSYCSNCNCNNIIAVNINYLLYKTN